MKCKKCNTEVSIADSKCPQCGNDLLQFESTIFYERKERDGLGFGKRIKGMVIQELGKDIKEGLGGLDPWERKVFLPIENRLRTLFARHISDSEIENLFENEIVPTIDGLSKDKAAEKIFNKVEEVIRNNLGFALFDHYKRKGEDVLKVLRAGEITCILVKENKQEIDLSVKVFPFFKATEVACRLHSQNRYINLKDSPIIIDINNWIGDRKDVSGKGIPVWGNKPLLDVIRGSFEGGFSSEFLRTGISVYILGRDCTLRIERRNPPKVREFQIKNPFQARGTDRDKEVLAESLHELNTFRNSSVHEAIEHSEKAVQRGRMLSYDCLKQLPQILEI